MKDDQCRQRCDFGAFPGELYRRSRHVALDVAVRDARSTSEIIDLMSSAYAWELGGV